MRIGVISDTHGFVPGWHKARAAFNGADIIIHAGDILYHPPRLATVEGYDLPGFARLINDFPGAVVAARGNCDPEVCEEILDFPVQSPYALLQLDGLRIVVNHGHSLNASAVRSTAEHLRADILVTGHTHVPSLLRIGSVLHLNPGSPSHPKASGGEPPSPTAALITDVAVTLLNLDSGQELSSMPLR